MRPPQFALFAIYVGIYCALLLWFKRIDVYHTYFDTTGWMVLAENAFRVLFVGYLFWIVHSVGLFVLRPIAGRGWAEMGTLSRLTLAFYAGTGVCHIVLLALGFLNLYTVPIAIVLTLPLVALSYSAFAATVLQARSSFASFLQIERNKGRIGYFRIGGAIAIAVLLAVVAGMLLLVKGLYPATGHDYAIHYFPYYQRVIALQGIWPNEAWYHFYYSKGAGLYFLGMLLTDPLAPQLVTACFFGASAIALYQLIGRFHPASLWPSLGVLLYLGLYIFTPGTGQYRANGGWADFEKLHELNTTLLIGIIWMSANALEQFGRLRLAWAVGTGLAIAAAVIANPTIGAYLGSVFGLLLLWNLLRRDFRKALVAFACAASAGVVVSVIFLLNYLVTGLINDQGILTFWPYANIDKLYELGTLPQAILAHRAHVGASTIAVPLMPGSILMLKSALRLEFLMPLVGFGLIAAAIAVALRRARLVASAQLSVLVAMLLALSILAIAAGRMQPVSFFRYSSFSTPIVIAAGALLFSVPQWDRSAWTRAVGNIWVPLMVPVFCGVLTWGSYPPGAFRQVLGNAAQFATGRISIDTAYSRQDGWAGRLPWGGIYPGARGAYTVVGPGVRIHTMHVHSYCMLPGCRMEIEQAFYVRDWSRIMFGSPEEARQAWQKSGINYFLFAKELRIEDSIPRSPLFSPDNIHRYLGIRWTDEKTALLTWLGPGVTPLNSAWLAAYQKAVAESATIRLYPYKEMKAIFTDLESKPHPWERPELPWEWQIKMQTTPKSDPEGERVTQGIAVVNATYGENCLAASGNATEQLRKACSGHDFCEYQVKHEILGDPAGGCSKNFIAEYACAPATKVLRQELPAEAGLGSILALDCRPPAARGPGGQSPPR